MAQFRIRFSEEDKQKLLATLDGIKNGTERALMRSINKTIPGVSTDAAKAAAQRINLAQKIIKKGFKTQLATMGNCNGSWKSMGKPVPLINYGARQTKTGVTFQVLKGGGRALLKHAFIATMGSGHQGVFWRTPRSFPPSSKPHLTPLPWKTLPKYIRLPIKELFGPKVEDTLSMQAIFDDLKDKAQERFMAAMEHETDYLLQQAAQGKTN
jgi:hypothetical protein